VALVAVEVVLERAALAVLAASDVVEAAVG
jgi:hypothetical protein